MSNPNVKPINLSINPQETTNQLVNFIQTILKKTGFSRLVIALSGGVDSATSLALGVKAVGEKNIYVGIFPCGELNKEGASDAQLLVKKFNIPISNVFAVDIKPLVEPITEINQGSGLKRPKGLTLIDLRKGNIMVRMRMILLYDMSKRYSALVLGTENKTEYLLGYFTRFGDEASDLEPLHHLYKTQVLQLTSFLGVPGKIIKKPPTAGMWLGQTDEGELGFTYEEADQILYLWHDKKHTKEAIVKSGFSSEIVDKVIKRATDNSFKHKLPYIPER